MVERVASAMQDRHNEWMRQNLPKGYVLLSFDELPDYSKEFRLAMARAALQAMREPTGVMTVAMMTQGSGAAIEDLDNAWRAAIDAAMEEKPS